MFSYLANSYSSKITVWGLLNEDLIIDSFPKCLVSSAWMWHLYESCSITFVSFEPDI